MSKTGESNPFALQIPTEGDVPLPEFAKRKKKSVLAQQTVDGRIIAYHGTVVDEAIGAFSVFKTPSFFAGNIDVAIRHVEAIGVYEGQIGLVFNVALSIDNPYVAKNDEECFNGYEDRGFMRSLKKAGYSGIICPEHGYWVAFHPDQIEILGVTEYAFDETRDKLVPVSGNPSADRPERTARSSRTEGPSRPAKLLMREYLAHMRNPTVLDYGAGHLRDTRWLKSLGYRVACYEPFVPESKQQCPFPAGKLFDVVFSNFVVNVIADPRERRAMIEAAWSFVKNGGLLFISARPHGDVDVAAGSGGWKRSGDGWMTPRNTFQRGFSSAELQSALLSLPDAVPAAVRGASGFAVAIVARSGGKK